MANTDRKNGSLVVIAVSRAVRDRLKKKAKRNGRSQDNELRVMFGLKPIQRQVGRPKKGEA